MASASEVATENADQARQYLHAIENHTNGHIENLDAIVAEDVVNHNPASSDDPLAGEEHGLEAFRRHAESVTKAFPDVHFDIRDVIAQDDRVMVRFILSGTHEGRIMGVDPTGREVTFSGIVVYRFEDGKIVERWSESNTVGLLQQLGVDELPMGPGE